jgi:hypothetical protein
MRRLQKNKAVVEMVRNFNLKVNEDDIEEFLEVASEKLLISSCWNWSRNA